MEKRKTTVSRRGFVGLAATLGTGAFAGSILSGCSPQNNTSTPTDNSSSDGSTKSSASDDIVLATTNPTDESYDTYTTDYAALFEPLTLGSLTLRNRFAKSAAGSDTFLPGTTELNDNFLDYYENFAKGGTAMIWIEGDPTNLYNVSVEDHSVSGFLAADNAAELIKPIADRIHAAGGFVGLQFFTMSFTCNDLTKDDIAFVKEKIVDLAKKLHDGGFDAFEMNASAAHFGNSFLSRATNLRDDEYGASSVEDRTRFHTELIKEIKAACGNDFVVQFLINGVEENDQPIGQNDKMITIEEAIENAQALEAAGADSFYIRSSVPKMHIAQFAPDLEFAGYNMEGNNALGSRFNYAKHYEGMAEGRYSGCAFNLKIAAEIKKNVNVPVGCSGYMDPRTAPDLMNNAVKDGLIDFMLMTRPLTVDPEMPNKLQEGRRDEVAPCTRCMHCHDRSKGGREVCRVNAATQRAYTDEMPEGYELPAATSSKKVVVVGGGPAGMEAARIAALRGHDVTLYEKDSTLGGHVKTANVYKGSHERLQDLIDYLVRQQELCGVNVVTDTEVDAATIKDASPDVVLLATGGTRVTKLNGSGNVSVVGIDTLTGSELGEDIIICGSNVQAIDCAAYLVAQGKNVQIVNDQPAERLGYGQSYWFRTYVIPALQDQGVRIWNSTTVNAVTDEGLEVTLDSGCSKVLPCSCVVECYDMTPNTDLADALSGSCDVVAIGDCNEPNNIAYAIAAGNLAARAL